MGCNDIGIKKSEFVAKTQFLYIWDFSRKSDFEICVAELKDEKKSLSLLGKLKIQHYLKKI